MRMHLQAYSSLMLLVPAECKRSAALSQVSNCCMKLLHCIVPMQVSYKFN